MMVYLGEGIPKYALKNYLSISRNFPTLEVWFIVDSQKMYLKLRKRDFRVWLAPKRTPGADTKRNAYRKAFWIKTTNRFYAMRDFHESHSDSGLLQIESDVIICPSFPMSQFQDIDQLLAFPMSAPEVGLASTLWSKSVAGSELLSNFTTSCLGFNPLLTDTDILGMLASSHPSEVLLLRSGPDNHSAYPSSPDSNVLTLGGSPHPINSRGIFDASTLGIHLCGTDPRNTFGISTVFDPLPHHFLKVGELDFSVSNGSILATVCDETREIYSLHNHAKNIQFFVGDFHEKLSTYLSRRKSGGWKKFSLSGLIGFILDYYFLAVAKLRITYNSEES